MPWLSCSYLGSQVEWTEERERHVAEQHPDLLPEYREKVEQTSLDPDEIRRSSRLGGGRLFSRWFADVRGGRHVVVVVISSHTEETRHWIITAYIARKLAQGDVEWKRS